MPLHPFLRALIFSLACVSTPLRGPSAALPDFGDAGMPAIVPGDAAKSLLIERIKASGPDEVMPPKDGPLKPAQIAVLEKWVAEGAQWPGQMDAVANVTSDLWSLKPVVRPALPQQAGAATPIDAYLLEKLRAKNLGYSGPAEARALIRRASVVLTGLAPAPERVEKFVADSKASADRAYAALIEELLASPRFGERWAQHWLDVIRWAESNGSEANLYRKNAWIYRDYVVRAFNDDVPYDRFVREQLAGDQLGAGEATGFLVAGPHVPAATVGREPTAIRQARADRMDEIMQTLGASVLGMTVSCARCHNHKFDPITIQDYYALTAVFQGVEFGGRRPELAAEHPREQRAKELYPRLNAERAKLREGAGFWEEDSGGYIDMAFPANDGEYGTMIWKAKAPEGSGKKPWVEIRFADAHEVNRFRFSSNREYYFETDYLEQAPRAGNLPGYRILAQQDDGTWKERRARLRRAL